MPQAGRPKVLDPTMQCEICTFVATGVSLSEAARLVGCNRSTIRNEAGRNERFRRDLQRAKSQTQMNPLRTMQQAAATNWRAAAWWLERLAPNTFAQPAGAVLGQREANKFAADLIEIVERVVSDPFERERLHELLSAALPAAMRRTWDSRQSRRKLRQAMNYFDGKPTGAADGDRPDRSSTPELPLGPEPRHDRVSTSLSDHLRRAVDAAKRPPPTASAQSATADVNEQSKSFSPRVVKNSEGDFPPTD